MDVSVIPIGNSRGIRLNKTLMEKYKIQDSVELILEEEHIILKAKPNPRKDWEQTFKTMHENNDDVLLIPDIFENEKFESWT